MPGTAERVLSGTPASLGSDAAGRQPLSEPMECLLQFHRAFGLPVAASPRAAGVAGALAELPIALLVEEVQEFADAARSGDIVALADALADIAYVTYGAALTYGINLDAVLREIHRSNMSKLGPDGRPIMRADGKVLKPATYRPPDLESVLAVQPPLAFDDM
jgi:predicted HAD superfamily Cof-like phosphohydrolase